jgi:hypothetical protein
MPTDADIENMSLQDLCEFQQAFLTDIISGSVAMEDAKPVIKRIERQLKATEQKLRDEGIIQKRRKV